jgi:hypothetical protein
LLIWIKHNAQKLRIVQVMGSALLYLPSPRRYGRETEMATIIINGITHRDVFLSGDTTAADAAAYDELAGAYFASLAAMAAADGFGFEVDERGQGMQSYRVTDEADEADYNAAHDFMQTAPGFWG